MLAYVVVCGVALLASGLTFFSGFGLGTLLLPAFALFFPVERAVALTGVVHFLNGVFKLALVWKHIDWPVLCRFGLPAIIGALAGAAALLWVAELPSLVSYTLFGRTREITATKLLIGLLLLLFATAEVAPSFRKVTFPARLLPVGGIISGFFGGLAGMQGALRSAFLVKAGLSKQTYVATGAGIAFLIDVSRLSVYSALFTRHHHEFDYALLSAAVAAAFVGATFGNYLLPKVTMGGIQSVVGVMLFFVAVGLLSGVL